MNETGIKKVVAAGIGAAIYIVLARFAAIPSPIPNTMIQITFAFLALMAFIYGPVTGLAIGFIGHTINDITAYGSPWFSFRLFYGCFRKIYRFGKFQFNKNSKIYNRRYSNFRNRLGTVSSNS